MLKKEKKNKLRMMSDIKMELVISAMTLLQAMVDGRVLMSVKVSERSWGWAGDPGLGEGYLLTCPK